MRQSNVSFSLKRKALYCRSLRSHFTCEVFFSVLTHFFISPLEQSHLLCGSESLETHVKLCEWSCLGNSLRMPCANVRWHCFMDQGGTASGLPTPYVHALPMYVSRMHLAVMGHLTGESVVV